MSKDFYFKDDQELEEVVREAVTIPGEPANLSAHDSRQLAS